MRAANWPVKRFPTEEHLQMAKSDTEISRPTRASHAFASASTLTPSSVSRTA